MSQKKRPARLWLRPDTGTWVIKDGSKRVSTECPEAEVAAAQAKLADYIAAQYQPERSSRSAEVSIGDVLLVYLDEKCPKTARPKETEAMIARLNDFFGDMLITEIRGKTCREFADDRGNEGGARRDLEVLRAAVNYYHAEYTLDMVPKITLPQKGTPRQKWLTRKEVAKLLRAARNEKQCGHLVRLIMIGLYTGTRLSAILNLQWIPNVNSGHVDLDRGVIYRKAEGERVAHNKRKTPVKIPPRLLRFLRYWKLADTKTDSEGRKVTLRYVVHYAGEKIAKPHKAFRTVRGAAGFDDDVTPHVLRHTRATWLAQAGIDTEQAAASLGLTSEEFERTYAHASPDFQNEAANAF
ncbi:tyrosine-type recombinase/integrase [Rhizobium rhizogenes]|uniref:tyrosine-type recombinase/integrase n=1 Tax=Rhizobium rhizogenes TaxID=359 RepID=UPI001F335B49|nr:site-specific integrase [Rhizobium rhizogenes]